MRNLKSWRASRRREVEVEADIADVLVVGEIFDAAFVSSRWWKLLRRRCQPLSKP
jgi:hypothetical protein